MASHLYKVRIFLFSPSFLLLLLLLLLLMVNNQLRLVNGYGEVVTCDKEKEFLCWSDNKCISKNKVCNFVNDCSNGDDESRCGSCKFEKVSRKCGLDFLADRVYGWFRRTPITNDNSIQHHLNSSIDYYMRLDLNRTLLQQINRHRNAQNRIYRPKVLFPHLRPTNNEKCSFSFKILITSNPARLDKESTLGISWPNVDLVLIQPKETKISDNDFIVGKHDREFKSFELDIRKNNAINHGRGEWHSYEYLLGARHTVWTMEIQVELTIKSYLVYLADFQFIDCDPIPLHDNPFDEKIFLDENPTEGPLNELDYVDDESFYCNINEFKCKLSGLCIDKSLVCDYGFDCGNDDTSDEQHCDDYPARCDFETESLCHWLPMPYKDSWLWMSADEEDELFYAKLPHPPVDHTFKSKHLGGHYLMINASQVKMSSTFGLYGPRVLLNDDYKACNVRFWAYVPQLIDNSDNTNNFDSPYLNVAYDRISARDLFSKNNQPLMEQLMDNKDSEVDKMFDLKTANFGWKRYNIELLNKDNNNNRSIETLQIILENFSKNTKTFIDNKLYLAIDDISFTPGCKIINRGEIEPNELVCGENQYQCKIPSPISRAFCIPIEYYCDFKNDCGLLIEAKASTFNNKLTSRIGNLAEDELSCPHVCHFNRADKQHCGVEIMDGTNLKLSNEIESNLKINEAFDWLIVDGSESIGGKKDENDGHLAIVSNFESFLNEFNRQQEENRIKNKIDYNDNQFNLKALRIELPTFSESHANCQFELTYKWLKDSKNLFALVLVSTRDTENLLKRIELPVISDNKDKQADNQIEIITFGVGQQARPFKLIILISFDDSIPHMINGNKPAGSLLIYSYKFITCSFYPGLIDPKKQVEFINTDNSMVVPANGVDDEYEGDVDFYEHLPPTQLETKLRNFNTTCDEGFFQCFEPIVCLPIELICDMQRDCQGGLDERACDKYLSFNFDDDLQKESYEKQLAWWNGAGELAERANYEWRRDNSNSNSLSIKNNRFNDVGPPYDHSKANMIDGWYLTMIKKNQDEDENSADNNNVKANDFAILKSPKFAATQRGSFNCRLVLYLYFWTNRMGIKNIIDDDESGDKFEILMETFPNDNNENNNNDGEKNPILLHKTMGFVVDEKLQKKKLSSLEDRWQKIDLPLDSNGLDFSIIIRGYSSSNNKSLSPNINRVIALDDISFTPECKLADNINTNAGSGSGANKITTNKNNRNSASSTTFVKILVTFLILFIIIATIILYQIFYYGSCRRTIPSYASSAIAASCSILGKQYTTNKFTLKRYAIKKTSTASAQYSLDNFGNDHVELSTKRDSDHYDYKRLSTDENISND